MAYGSYVVDMSDNNVNNAIVVVQKALTSSAMKVRIAGTIASRAYCDV
jgi:hypothetical protein